RIMSLQDPTKKMSKSDESNNGVIMLDDDADAIRKKIMRAITDTDGRVAFDPDKKPAVSNLMTIYHHVTGNSLKEIETRYEGKGYGDFKKDLAERLIEHLTPIRTRLVELREDPKRLNKLLDEGRDVAGAIAEKKMKLVRDRMGLGRA
ncbi:MAG: tryptophan--tRNA ligase, partial [Candidatus Uhrbacteria bacterium]|nr:tryptophan--tRNA ligase [Candidatus Uhrbacteria bacterium]